MMTDNNMPNMQHDFSHLSKARLRTYNLMLQEIDKMEQHQDVVEIADDDLEYLAAAGIPNITDSHNDSLV